MSLQKWDLCEQEREQEQAIDNVKEMNMIDMVIINNLCKTSLSMKDGDGTCSSCCRPWDLFNMRHQNMSKSARGT